MKNQHKNKVIQVNKDDEIIVIGIGNHILGYMKKSEINGCIFETMVYILFGLTLVMVIFGLAIN
jgi:hypothetical protein